MSNDAKHEVIRQVLAGLENDGRLTPDDVVAAARDPESPLHSEFEWDDSVAAERYRLDQARTLISSVRLVVVEDKRIIQTVAYVRDPEAGPKEQGYRRTVTLRDDSEKARAAVLNELSRVAAHLSRARSIGAAIGLDAEMAEMEAGFAELRLRVERPAKLPTRAKVPA